MDINEIHLKESVLLEVGAEVLNLDENEPETCDNVFDMCNGMQSASNDLMHTAVNVNNGQIHPDNIEAKVLYLAAKAVRMLMFIEGKKPGCELRSAGYDKK